MFRLLIAFLLVVALPVQGIAASTCTCKLQEGRVQLSAAHLMRSAAANHGSSAASLQSMNVAHALGTGKGGTRHQSCAGCAKLCCQATAPAPEPTVSDQPAAVGETYIEYDLPYASWAEPVPREPPRF